MSATGIFINYRREDASGQAGRLFDGLAGHFGRDRIFMDVDTIPPGVDFVTRIEEALASCGVFLAVIGPNWLDARAPDGSRRLDDPSDFVRVEVAAALQKGTMVVPVLVQRAQMPGADQLPRDLLSLSRRNAFELRDSTWGSDLGRLIEVLALGAPARPLVEERKVITCLFCNLMAFPAASESADPEDVDQMLSAYSAMAHTQIEAHGGAVEKFIGDAVVGIFGVPASHEDDPERAVRAGLRIVEDASELEAVGGAPLRLCVGINTGEALVRLGVTPGSEERLLSGDAINTASRLQSAAPEMGVAVGLATYEATAMVFDYEEMAPATLKGKAGEVRVFHAKAPRSRLGTDLTRTHDTPFIGHEVDLVLLKGIFDKAVAATSVQLVTVVGEPGLGKSRIVAELFAHIDTQPRLVTWRQGRCLPYGEGITFWALGEIVKAHAGILESDAPDVAISKLDAVLPEGSERAWFGQRLLPLLGIESTSQAEREELFTAWRRFLEKIAEDDPTVLVFEDLHWGDEAMLAFLEHLADRAEGVPLLVIGTARPELFERHPDYAAGLHNVNRINLSPLSEEETARLVAALLETPVIPVELQQPILNRAEGNPLYAEEFVRLLKDKDLLVKKGSSWELKEGAKVPFPGSVQALIAARLDTVEPEAKSMLADAAVVGKVFWAGAVAAMGGRDLAEVTGALRELSRQQFVRPARRSSMEGEAEYAFWHVLTRDVAYAELPRAARADRHVAAAKWIEAKAAERVEDLAEVLAHHYSTALELVRAAGRAAQADELEAQALRFLTLAGERALGLNTAAAVEFFEKALTLTPTGHTARPAALSRFGAAALQAGRPAQAAEALEEAIAAFRERGDPHAAARAIFILATAAWLLGDGSQRDLGAEALALLEPLPPSPELVGALAEVAINRIIDGEHDEGSRAAERALALATELGLKRPARALGFLGVARCARGEAEGLDELREALRIATAAGEGREAAVIHGNLGNALYLFEGPTSALKVLLDGIALAEARGLAEMALGLRAGTLDVLFDTGEWEEARGAASELAKRAQAAGNINYLQLIRRAQARILSLSGEAEKAAEFLDWLETTDRQVGSAESLVAGHAASMLARAALGQSERAAQLLGEIEATPHVREVETFPTFLPAMVRTALGIGLADLAERLAAGLRPLYPYAEHALITAKAALSEASGDLEVAADSYAETADRWERFGVVPEHGFALLGQGRCLVGLVRATEATNVLRRAREIFKRLGATPALVETDALLKEATLSSS